VVGGGKPAFQKDRKLPLIDNHYQRNALLYIVVEVLLENVKISPWLGNI
jgi:hypothetical protein